MRNEREIKSPGFCCPFFITQLLAGASPFFVSKEIEAQQRESEGIEEETDPSPRTTQLLTLRRTIFTVFFCHKLPITNYQLPITKFPATRKFCHLPRGAQYHRKHAAHAA